MAPMRGVATLIVGSAGAVTALLIYRREQARLWASSAAKPESEQHYRSQHKWDSNWDKMAPEKKSSDENGEIVQSKASRTLILIRHGHYVWDPDDPEKRILTELGRKQAAITGQRLKELGHDYTMLHYSTMPRATETADIIRESLVGVPAKSCDLMREGAPIRPEPMHRTWKPESYVSFHSSTQMLHS